MAVTEASYRDEKGRVPRRANGEAGARLKQLGAFLVVGGYEESLNHEQPA